MAIPEKQLETWSHRGSVSGSSETYQTVRKALLAEGTGHYAKSVEVFLQGSYGNETNIYSESDVDVVIRLDSTFYKDLSKLSPEDRERYDSDFSAATYGIDEFKGDVVSALKDAFGSSFVEAGPKAIWIKPNGSRRNADVIAACQYRRYYKFRSSENQSYDEGICFWRGSEQIINYPKQHAANCTSKHQATNGWFKPMVRILKNMRSRMVADGVLADGVAPSYYLEGLLYNVPSEKFGSSYEDTFVNAYNWIVEAERNKFVCANEQYYLLRNNNAVTWPIADGNEFIEQLGKFWTNW